MSLSDLTPDSSSSQLLRFVNKLKLLLLVVVIDRIVYLRLINMPARVDSCPRLRKYAHRRTRLIWPATYN